MKNTKITKIAILVLSLALLIGAATAIGISAESGTSATEDTILAQNIVYGEKVSIAYAVNATVEDAAAGDVTVNYYWEGDSENVKTATYLTDTVYTKDGVDYPVFATEGVAAKELAKVAYVTTDGSTYKTYSAAEYLYVRLYEDGFAAKTSTDGGEDGKDYNRKLLYESLLTYGEQAQIVLGYNTDKLVTDYSIAYTASELINLAGKSYVFGYGDISVEGTVIGEGAIAGWTVTDLVNGGSSDSDDVLLSLNGVYNVEPIFGVHECVDEDNDHLCDSCGETVSECKNENGDHNCDICGKVVTACSDSNTDGKCDVCAKYIFDVTTMSSGNGVSFVNIAANSGTDYTTASGTVTLNGRPDGYTKGTWLYLETDPTNAANTVLASNSVSASSMTDDAISDVIFTPDVQVEGGDLIVLEYDYYVDGCTNKKNSMKFVYNYADGTTSRANATYVTSEGIRLNADTDGSMRWSLDTWVRVRLVCDNTNKKIYTYLSTDSGVTYTLCETVTDATATVSSVGFTYIGYGVAATQYYDNLVCVQTNAATYGITFE